MTSTVLTRAKLLKFNISTFQLILQEYGSAIKTLLQKPKTSHIYRKPTRHASEKKQIAYTILSKHS